MKLIYQTLLLFGVIIGGCLAGETQPPENAIKQCKNLDKADLAEIQDAPTQIISANLIKATNDLPEHCEVQGYISPNIGIMVKLPTSNWNGKFLKAGCGGYCGDIRGQVCNRSITKGYACVVSDMGHKSARWSAKWAYNNLQAEIDYGYRATHVATLAGKAITEKYYHTPPKKSYFLGCSGGGRQALVAAQYFPWDFDGIVAGAPAINLTGVVMNMLWSALANRDDKGELLLNEFDLQFVNESVIKKCDLDDGLKDGIIDYPPSCNFNPEELVCESERGNKIDQCLNTAQILALKKIYSGPTTSKGKKIHTGGFALGSELSWINNQVISFKSSGKSPGKTFINDMFRYMAFMPDPGPDWKESDFDFDKDYKRLGMMDVIHGGTNPDLRKFKAAGGKLIVYHGWNDNLIPAINTIDYYNVVEKTMGGEMATQDFFRLFLVPGMEHCSGGIGINVMDYLSYIEQWVEQDKAPSKVLGLRLKPDTPVPAGFTMETIDPATIEYSRPLYPYPGRARYKGIGDTNKSSSFSPAKY